MARTGLEEENRRQGAWHRTLVYFGLADDDQAGASGKTPDESLELLRALERRVDDNTRAIDALREDIARLRST